MVCTLQTLGVKGPKRLYSFVFRMEKLQPLNSD